MTNRISIVVLAILASAAALAQSADIIQKTLNAEAAKLPAWTTEKVLVDAVKAQNAKKVAQAEIERIDKQWIAGGAANYVKQTTTGPCADKLRQLVATQPYYSETFVMDDKGALVCTSQKTSDYWQGDEAKWIRAWNGGKGAVFIDRPRFDESAKERLAQISLPIADGGKVIGTITIGIDVDKLKK